jgi:hypothetical protein
LYFYIQRAGVSATPWDSEDVFSIAQGDDGVIFTKPEFADAIKASILQNTSRTTDA